MIKNNLQESIYTQHLIDLGHDKLTSTMIKGLDAWYNEILPADKEAHILDYSCGCGDFIAYLIKNGYKNVQGCDINSDLIKFVSSKYDVLLHVVSNLRDFSCELEAKFDLIHMKDVIEHIDKKHVISDLILIRDMLKDNGDLIVSCPQMSGFTSLFTLYNDFTHTTLFTENSLKFALSAAGFQNIHFVIPNEIFSFKPTTMCFRILRGLWFRFVQAIYFLERPGEQMPKIKGDRITVIAEK